MIHLMLTHGAGDPVTPQFYQRVADGATHRLSVQQKRTCSGHPSSNFANHGVAHHLVYRNAFVQGTHTCLTEAVILSRDPRSDVL